MKKHMNLFRLTCLVIALITLSGCTWVKSQEGADAIALVKPSVTRLCNSLGRTTVQTKPKLGFIPRDSQKIALELLTLAKNAAYNLGGDTIVATIPATEGKQEFAVYKCGDKT